MSKIKSQKHPETSDLDEQTHESSVLTRLPLWKECLRLMRERGLEYNQGWPSEFFEEQLRCERNSMEFSLSVSEIRRELEGDGFYLSGRGQNGKQFVILQPNQNVDVMRGYSSAAADALRRGVILGTSTQLDSLTDSERYKHEAMLQKMATKSMLLQRSGQIARIVAGAKKQLLE